VTRLLAIATLISMCGCTEAALEDCGQQTGRDADLCWARVAEQALPADPSGFSAALDRISDTKLRDITVLAVVRKMEDPKDRFDACQRIRDKMAKERCLTYEVRVHLWARRAPVEGAPVKSAHAVAESSADCAGLPEGLQDACELEAVLSAASWRLEATPGEAPDGARCLAIRDPEARGLCRAEIATQIAHASGLEAGVSACMAIETPVYRKDCLLRVRTTHPEASMARQLEICDLSEELARPCRVMVSISAPAHLLEVHGKRPALEALAAMDIQVREYAEVVRQRRGADKAEQLSRTIWYRTFSRVVGVHYGENTTTEALRQWIPLLMSLPPADPRRTALRASLLRAYGTVACPGKMAPSDVWCGQPAALAQRFSEWLELREQKEDQSSALSAPLISTTVDASDWWAVYKSDPGRVPLSLVYGCAMDSGTVDELAAMTALSGGAWAPRSMAFKAGLHSRQGIVREYTVRRLVRRLFTEGFRLDERERIAQDLRLWSPEMAHALRALLDRLSLDIEQGKRRQPVELIQWAHCPNERWPEEDEPTPPG
jgi:hypothetical protein